MGQRTRLDETHAREGEIPFYCSYEDGSEYEVFWNENGRSFTRRFHGPKFGRKKGDWKTVIEVRA